MKYPAGFQIAPARRCCGVGTRHSAGIPFAHSAALAAAGMRGCRLGCLQRGSCCPVLWIHKNLSLGSTSSRDSQHRKLLSRRKPCQHLPVNKVALLPPASPSRCAAVSDARRRAETFSCLVLSQAGASDPHFALSCCWQPAQLCASEAVRKELIQQ